jgi:ribonuclease R
MRSLFDGDTVLVAVTGVDSRGRPEGKVVEVLERGVSRVVGRYQEESGIGVVLPDNARINQDILIPPAERRRTARPDRNRRDHPVSRGTAGGQGRIVEVLGEHLDPGLEIDIAIRSHGDSLRVARGSARGGGSAAR